MPDGLVRLPPDSTGTALRTVTNAGVAAGAHQEVVTLAAADGSFVVPATQATLEAVRVLLAATLSVAGSIGLDASTLAALETISVANFPASQAVTGPLTDTQLRAVPVPVSFPADEAGLTNVELRAAPVPVSGTVGVNNFPASQTVAGTVALDGTTLTALEQIEARSPLRALNFDYTGRTDTQPVYLGFAVPATADATVAWTVTRFTYESAVADARVTRSDVRSPIKWTSRTDPTLDGQPAW